MKKVIIDTNFLLIPSQFKVDIFAQIEELVDDKVELCIIDKTIDELQKIIDEQSGKNKAAAQFGLQLIEKKRLTKLVSEPNEKSVDDEILSLAKKEDILVATQDKELKSRLKELGTKTIILRQKNHLALG